jgi:D-alanine--poly(phosphoribitol) ligase subunit 1
MRGMADSDARDRSVFEWIVAHAQLKPDWPAVKDLSVALTYGELVETAGRVASTLSERGVGQGDRVALLIPNSADFVISAVACMWIEAIFVPLAVTDPTKRLEVILEDCLPALVIEGDLQGQADRPGGVLNQYPSVTMSSLLESSTELDAPPLPSRRDAAVYAIYTSGTTGTPKGVLIGSEAFSWAVAAAALAVGANGTTRTLCVSPFHFDGSFATLFPTLFSGGSVVLRPRDALLFPRTFFNAVASESITYTGFSPSYLRLLIGSGQLSKLLDTELEVLALGGEASSISDVRTLWNEVPGLRVFNRYGPTETTIAVTNVELLPSMLEHGYVPIGAPHAGVSFYILGEDGEIIEETGTVGELYIGGKQLMKGYWRAPELTAQAMRDDVIAGEIVYRTGDLAFQDADGNYAYSGRIDGVIKRSGVRISLIEMTQVMQQLTDVSSAVCTPFDNEGRLGIVAFVVTSGSNTVHTLQLEAREHLPPSMIPDRYEFVDSFPLARSSKIDEHRLLAEAGLRPPLIGESVTEPGEAT